MEASPLTVDEIKRRLSKPNNRGASGLDGWAPKEMKRLPRKVLGYLSDFYNLVECMGFWPQALTHAAVTSIPKGEGSGPLDQRPLSILPIIYRVWAAARCAQCNLWQERWTTSGQHKAWVKHDCADALVRITGEMESAMLNLCSALLWTCPKPSTTYPRVLL